MTTPRNTTFKVSNPDDAIFKLTEIYNKSAQNLRDAFENFVKDGTPPDLQARRDGAFAYPRLSLAYRPRGPVPAYSRSFGKFDTPGIFETDITRPALFSNYLKEQLQILYEEYEFDCTISLSDAEIPYPYVLDKVTGVDVDSVPPAELAHYFPVPNLALIDDSLPNGDWPPEILMVGTELEDALERHTKPLSLFSALRTDYSLQRLKHYTGTQPEDFQQFILFTNYQRYMDEFVELSINKLETEDHYIELVAPGNVRINAETVGAMQKVADAPWRKHQMPAYHLKAENGQGITLVNIGVGPSNSKTITDHLAVLRPQCWIMIGHCGGLRHSQRLGDYVLAHAYLRHDGVLDEDLPPEIPVPPIAEIQLALTAAAGKITGDKGAALKSRLRTGTVVTNDDRNWELRYHDEAHRFNQSRAIAVDMESATLAANGYRFRVPYGTLLCVSDKPLHGEIKLPGAANRFYEKAISEHMLIGIETMEQLRKEGAEVLHSRKLRSFEEPPFR